MKMALSEFVLRKKGIYGILHVIILLLSLFLVISISIDTFKGIPFYEQSVYMEVQLWICALFLADFVLEWFLATDKMRYVATHFIFLLWLFLIRISLPIWAGLSHPKSPICCVSSHWYGAAMPWPSWWDG